MSVSLTAKQRKRINKVMREIFKLAREIDKENKLAGYPDAERPEQRKGLRSFKYQR